MSEAVTPIGMLVTDAPPESDAWFEARRGGITGTDLPKILGDTKYGNALSVWLDKRGELDEDDVGEAAYWGQVFEDPVAQRWAALNDRTVERVGVIANTGAPWIRASLDRLVRGCDEPCGLEVKTRTAFKKGSFRDDMPDDVLAQVAWGRLVSGLDHMHVAVLIGGQELLQFTYDRDDELERFLREQAYPVWQAVLNGYPPDVEPGADGVLLSLLNRMYSKREGDRDVDADEATRWLEQYAAGADLAKQGAALKDQAKAGLVQLLDDGEAALIGERVAYTYRRPAPGLSLPAKQLKRLATDVPETYSALLDQGFIIPTNPAPRLDIKEN